MDLAEYLAKQISEGRAREARLQIELLQVQAQVTANENALNFFRNQNEVKVSTRTSTVTIYPSGEKVEEGEDENNAMATRKFFRDRAAKGMGVRPRDLTTFYLDSNLAVHKNYTYSILARLKKRKEIELKGGKYRPTQKLLDAVASAEGNGAQTEKGAAFATPSLYPIPPSTQNIG